MPKPQQPASDLGAQAIALAEQLGRIAGTIEGKAETWLHRPALADQLTRVRDGATQMLETLAAAGRRGRAGRKKTAAAPAGRRAPRMADPAHAPGKKRRKPAPSMRGVKKSDERIPKTRTADVVRRRRKY